MLYWRQQEALHAYESVLIACVYPQAQGMAPDRLSEVECVMPRTCFYNWVQSPQNPPLLALASFTRSLTPVKGGAENNRLAGMIFTVYHCLGSVATQRQQLAQRMHTAINSGLA